jgi:DNA-directed RNA polymerase specialized sigma24 family protein
MSSPEVSLWWDKDLDHSGRPIRSDVRAAAHRVWNSAHKTAKAIGGDGSCAAELMEDSVAQVSRYLDRGAVVVFSREIDGLLMLSFRRAVRRRLARVRRLESLGGVNELSNRAVDRTWTRQIHARLELEQVVRLLSERSRSILTLRYAGYTWKEAAQIFNESVPALRSAFWRDVTRVKMQLRSHRSRGNDCRLAVQHIDATD